MTQHEAAQVLAILKAAYPNSYKNMTPEEATGTVNVWAMQFVNVPADIVMMAVHKLISISQFPPSISEVNKKLLDLHWEAYEYVNGWRSSHDIEKSVLDQYTRIYEETEQYRHKSGFEPTLYEMINQNNIPLLSNGKE